MIIHKMLAGRPRDLEDVTGLLRKNPQIDLAYLRPWLEQFEQALQRPLWAPFKQFLDETYWNKHSPPPSAKNWRK